MTTLFVVMFGLIIAVVGCAVLDPRSSLPLPRP